MSKGWDSSTAYLGLAISGQQYGSWVAVDSLPPSIIIPGVPRWLAAKDLTGMTCSGLVEPYQARLHQLGVRC